MNSNHHYEDEDDFSFFDLDRTDNAEDNLWLRLDTGERIYLGYPDDLCRQCYQREGFNNIRIGKCRFLVCDDCERRNFPMTAQLTKLVH